MKKKLILITKILVTILTIYWVYTRHDFDFRQVAAVVTNPTILAFFFVLTFIKLILTTYRLHLLLPIELSKDSFKNILMTSWASTFLSNFAPSTIVGEIYKVKKISDDNTKVSKDQTLHSTVLVKVYTIFSYVVTAFAASLMMNSEQINNLVVTRFYLGLFCALFTMGPYLLDLVFRFSLTNYPPTEREFSANFLKRRFQHFLSFYISAKEKNFYFFRMIFSSIAIQILTVLIFMLILKNIAPGFNFTLIEGAFHFTYSYFISTLPISIGGLGVGHIAFAETLKSVGYKQGADVFTIFFILSSVFNVIGIMPFLYGLFKRNK